MLIVVMLIKKVYAEMKLYKTAVLKSESVIALVMI